MSDTSGRKLAGWKEIANYLNTSVRTAQRWEQELGLPVHHVGSSKGYSVLADMGELEVWLKGPKGSTVSSDDRPSPTMSTESRTRTPTWGPPKLLATAAIAVVAAGSILAMLRLAAAHPAKVSSVTFSGQQMLAWSNGKVVWSYDFGQPTRSLLPEQVERKVQILPSGQIIVAAPLLQLEAGTSTDAIYCFSARGKVLWRQPFADRVHFGGEECGPIWEAHDLIVTGSGKNTFAWCTICSYLKSVAIVVRVDLNGTTAKWFVNYGHLGQLKELRVGGGPYILVGGINNETNNATLAVLDETRPAGHSPQTGALAECECCPEGQPYHYFLFPRSEVIRVTGPPYNGVKEIVVANGQIQVMTMEGVDDPSRGLWGLWALYDISEALVPQSVFFSDFYWFAHEKLSAEGKIKHSLTACPERLKPITVRKWSADEGWKNIMLPPIGPKLPK